MKITIVSNTATVIPPLVFAAAQNYTYPSGGPVTTITPLSPIITSIALATTPFTIGGTNVTLVSTIVPFIGGRRVLILGFCQISLAPVPRNMPIDIVIGATTVSTFNVTNSVTPNTYNSFCFLWNGPSPVGNTTCKLFLPTVTKTGVAGIRFQVLEF